MPCGETSPAPKLKEMAESDDNKESKGNDGQEGESGDSVRPATTSSPLFLKASVPETWAKPDGVSWGDHFLKPGKALSSKHRAFARMIFEGKTVSDLKEAFGYDDSRISILKSNSQIKQEVIRLEEKAFAITVQERLKELGPIAVDLIEEALINENSELKMKDRIDTAKWAIEKLTGRPKQEVDVQHSTLHTFMDMIREMKSSGQVIDVTPTKSSSDSPAPGDPMLPAIETSGVSLKDWVDENT